MSQSERALSMPEYLDLVSDLPTPSVEQMNDFAEYVSSAHSWYKHLPAVPPGVSFFFYLDPCAGLSHIIRSNGHIDLQEREEKGFHYSDLPTREYRNRFGFLAYSCLMGTSVSLNFDNGDSTLPPDKSLSIRISSGHMVQLPDEILRAGQSLITAAVYHVRHTNGILIHRMRYEREKAISRSAWQVTDFGSIAVDNILHRVDRLSEDKLEATNENQPGKYEVRPIDSSLVELLTEERCRQLTLMTNAMQNVIALIVD